MRDRRPGVVVDDTRLESFVVRADRLNRPLRTGTVGGVGAGAE